MSEIGKDIEREARAQLDEAAAAFIISRSGTAAAMCSEAHSDALRYYEGERKSGASGAESVNSATQYYIARLRKIAAWIGFQGASDGA